MIAEAWADALRQGPCSMRHGLFDGDVAVLLEREGMGLRVVPEHVDWSFRNRLEPLLLERGLE